MQPLGLEKARKRFERAQQAYQEVREAPGWAEFELAWSDFLLASNAIYSLLEQAAKSSSKGGPWFGVMKKKRKDDPLLSYMHHVRNSDGHGIEPVAQGLPWLAGAIQKGGQLVSFTTNDGVPISAVGKAEDGDEQTLTFSSSKPQLMRVFDRRYGDWFDPPTNTLEENYRKAILMQQVPLSLPTLMGC